jgi:hypothetical protein
MGNEKAGGFGNILNKLKGAIFTQEYMDSQEVSSPAKPDDNKTKVVGNAESSSAGTVSAKTTVVPPIATSNVPAASQEEMINKIHGLLENMNKPGIDFFELWNAAEAMGSINAQNVSNAYVALKIASGNTLNKEVILQSGQYYSDNLKTLLENDIKGKIAERDSLTSQKSLTKNTLGQEITDLNNKIAEMQKQLQEKNTRLANIEQEFDPKAKEIEQKIAIGQASVQTVTNEINQVLDLVKTNITA